ncbi:MAG: hypothetical protein K0R59_2907 [Sphingobacterium sp.]|nr:hypothetical protein [Sphingobacterium sp.]
MAETVQPRAPKTTDNNANQTHYYKTLVVAIVIAFKTVFGILGFGKNRD